MSAPSPRTATQAEGCMLALLCLSRAASYGSSPYASCTSSEVRAGDDPLAERTILLRRREAGAHTHKRRHDGLGQPVRRRTRRPCACRRPRHLLRAAQACRRHARGKPFSGPRRDAGALRPRPRSLRCGSALRTTALRAIPIRAPSARPTAIRPTATCTATHTWLGLALGLPPPHSNPLTLTLSLT